MYASPYINHSIQVAQILAETGGITDTEILAAAVLHDTVEDTETTLNELERLFGARVARVVGEVTDDKTLPKDERKRLQIDHARGISHEGALVKIADKISNVQDIASNPPESWGYKRRLEYLGWARQVVSNCPMVSDSLDRCFGESMQLAEEMLGSAPSGKPA